MSPDLTLASILKDWIIPLGAVIMMVWFAASAKKDADRAQSVLTQINEAVQGAQRKMIESATGILDSLPQVIDGKTALAKTKAIETLLATIRENIPNPRGLPKEQHDQNILALSAHLDMLIRGPSAVAK